jgi:uncharacterized delta-60 repeat protein
VSRRSRGRTGTVGVRATAFLLAGIGAALVLGAVARSGVGPTASFAAAKSYATGMGGLFPDSLAVGSTTASGREGRSSSVDAATALAVGQDGKPVVAGVSGRHGRSQMALARYTTRGSPDRSFGVGGKALTSFGSGTKSSAVARAVALQADGKVVLAGDASGNFALARYTARGRLDPSFGQNGKVVTHFGSRRSVSEVEALAIQPDGKIVAVGGWSGAAGLSRFALARYTSRRRCRFHLTVGTRGRRARRLQT